MEPCVWTMELMVHMIKSVRPDEHSHKNDSADDEMQPSPSNARAVFPTAEHFFIVLFLVQDDKGHVFLY